MAIGVSFRPLKGRFLKAQQFTEDLWLDGKSILARMLLRARKRPARGSTNRTKCSKMEQLAPSFQFSIPSCLAISPRLQFPTRHPALPAVSPLFTSGVWYSASPSSSSTAFGSHHGLSSDLAQHQRLVSAGGTLGRVICGAWAVNPSGDCRRRVSGRIPQLSSKRQQPSVSTYQSASSNHLRSRKSLSAAEIDRQVSNSLHQRCNRC